MKSTLLLVGRALAKLAVPAATILLLCPGGGASAASYETFDPQGSVNTIPTGIDSKGRIYGYWDDTQSVRHGFVRGTNGKIVTFDVPGAVSTFVSGTDAKGNAVGYFSDGTIVRSYLRSVAGEFIVFDIQGASTRALATDQRSGTVGYFGDDANQLRGFLRNRKGKTKIIDAPDALEVVPTALNASGTVSGWIYNSGGHEPTRSAFIRLPGEDLTIFNVKSDGDTQITGMNANNITVGYCSVGADTSGFVRSADGEINKFDPKDSENTIPLAIGADGTVTGFYQKPDLAVHGFVRTPDKKITSFDVKGARDTFAQAINATDVIAGYWLDTGGINHGFVRVP